MTQPPNVPRRAEGCPNARADDDEGLADPTSDFESIQESVIVEYAAEGDSEEDEGGQLTR